jgi:hypothetical protein
LPDVDVTELLMVGAPLELILIRLLLHVAELLLVGLLLLRLLLEATEVALLPETELRLMSGEDENP